MPCIKIADVIVNFPFTPYDCQKDYMRCVLEALQNSQNAILESPTGTGKTMCLLCASLAWQEELIARCQLTKKKYSRGTPILIGGTVSSEHPSVALHALDRDQLPGLPHGEQEEFLTNARKVQDDMLTTLESHVGQWSDLNTLPKIIFASRTHAQLSQVIRAFKTTAYKTRKVGIIGSRDQLCIHPEVKNLDSNQAKVMQCRARVQKKTCEYHRNYETHQETFTQEAVANHLVDIEDLVKHGTKRCCCPYYLSRGMMEKADIIFMPYNYLLDGKIRRLYDIKLENSVIIFDEAHNIEQVCEDVASFSLSSIEVSSAIEELTVLGEELHSAWKASSVHGNHADNEDESQQEDWMLPLGQDKDGNKSNLNLGLVLSLKGKLLELENLIDAMPVPSDGVTHNGDYVIDLLSRADLSIANRKPILQLVDMIQEHAANSTNYKLHKCKGINHIADFLKTIFSDVGSKDETRPGQWQEQMNTFYRVHVHDSPIEEEKKSLKAKSGWDASTSSNNKSAPASQSSRNRILSYWCFSPGRAMQELSRQRPRSIILTSGTLYPITALKLELHLTFGVELQNPHVIAPDQVRVCVVTKGPDGVTLNSSFNMRDRSEYHLSLGNTIANFARIVPRGLLVFFPSYSFMQMCVSKWQSSDIFPRIVQLKEVVVEPRDSGQFAAVIQEYQAKVHNKHHPGGALLMAVARGKVSEGLDLADHSARGVVLVGLPYPPLMEPRIKLKMNYLDEKTILQKGAKECTLTGRQWYQQQAWRAINQAVGRVIRHHKDFGAVLLCDERFASVESRSQLPRWMQKQVQVETNFGAVVRTLVDFYRTAEEKYPPPPLEGTGVGVPMLHKNRSGMFSSRSNAAGRDDATEDSGENLQLADVFFSQYSSDVAPAEATNPSGDQPSALLQVLNSFGSSRPQTSAPKLKTMTAPEEPKFPQCSHPEPPRKRLRLMNTKSSTAPETGNVDAHEESSAAMKEEEEGCSQEHAMNQLLASLSKDTTTRNPGVVKTMVQLWRGYHNKNVSCREMFSGFVRCLQSEESVTCMKILYYALTKKEDIDLFQRLYLDKTGTQLPQRVTMLQDQRKSDEGNSAATLESVECVACRIRPVRIPMASAVCSHVACFACWRSIIEEGGKKCPRCRGLVRKRDLRKLTA